MKIQGKEVTAPKEELLVIPRGEESIVIKAQPVLDFEDFEKLCPTPQPPEKMFPGGETSLNVEDPEYLQKLNDWGQQKTDWMILKSLDATEDLVWDTVDKADPTTWKNYRDELDRVFNTGEMAAILQMVTNVLGLNQKRVEEATKSFLVAMQDQQE